MKKQDLVNVTLIQPGKTTLLQVAKGTSFAEIVQPLQEKHSSPIVAVRVDFLLRELFKPVTHDCQIELVDLKMEDGVRIYERGVIFLLSCCVDQALGGKKLIVYHSIGAGLYCEIEGYVPTKADLSKLSHLMGQFAAADIPFKKERMEKFAAIAAFEKRGMAEKVTLLKYRKKDTVNVYWFKNYINYFYGYMLPSTAYIKDFKLLKDRFGFILFIPHEKTGLIPTFSPQPKLSQIFLEHKKWAQILGVKYVGDLNDLMVKGESQTSELIHLSEGLHEKKIAQIADAIARRKKTKIVLVAGPTSSGKTTFSKRLCLQLRINGLRPAVLSLDDYFCDREKSPRDEAGRFDFEDINCIQLDLLNDNLKALLQGKAIQQPRYDFKTGKSIISSKQQVLGDNEILIIEGIHGLNERLTASVLGDYKYKIFINALTQLDLDSLNRIHATDTRILRRIVRDFKYRGTSPGDTLGIWSNVRKGEYRNIFPFQENADIFFNSALPYELAVLKIYAEPVLQSIGLDREHYSEVKRLIRFLDYFLPVNMIHKIPGTSILREFIGESFFKY